MVDGGGRDEDVAVEVGEHQLGARLGTVDADDAEVLGTDVLDAWVEHAARLGDGRARHGVDGRLRVREVAMRPASSKRDRAHLILAAGSSGKGISFIKTHIPGDGTLEF